MEQIKQTVGAVKPPVKVSGNPVEDMKVAQNSPEAASFIAEFYKRQLERMDVEDQVSEALKEKKRLEHLMVMAENAKEQQAKENGQANCTHMNAMGTATAIRGNRNGARKVIAICQRCQKVWQEQETGGYLDKHNQWMLPHLHPDPDKHIGGIV